MKKILLIVALAATTFGVVSFSSAKTNEKELSESVYICTGSHAKKYHASSNCRGLNNCRGEVVKVSISRAKQEGKTACKICY